MLRGLDPMGVPDRRADLEDVETGELIRVPIAELEPRLRVHLQVERWATLSGRP